MKVKAQDDGLRARPPNPPQWGNSFDGIFRIDGWDKYNIYSYYS